MSFSDLHENENLAGRLKHMIRSGRIFHGCIFEGKEEDTEPFADAFVKAALCERQDGEACGVCASCRKFEAGNSEDVSVIGAEGTVRDRDIEDLIAGAMKKSYTGRPVFMIVRHAERMTLRAQNRLLKTLEEPPSGVKILLLTENAQMLAPTVRSRCIFFRLHSSEKEEDLFPEEELRQAWNFAFDILSGRPFYALSEGISHFSSSAEIAQKWVSAAETLFRDVFVSFYDSSRSLIINTKAEPVIRRCAGLFSAEEMAEAVLCAENARRDLAFRVSPKHALKYMIFDIQEKLKTGEKRR